LAVTARDPNGKQIWHKRNTGDEKKAIKEGRIPANWKAKPAKLRHKDRDARWTVKFSKAKPREDGSMPPVDHRG
jgi:hypothetical protein